ncbi:hypothetical protein [Cylindrospermopsis raciborskii]|uniref:hypothetical protein n=1 Tax=Cylindrospermopsis raciborskii TaxID=77022 RepID=UPI0011C022D7|nr:hypothetical protein [Cylindrospermopsis raciborskii]UJL34883.1 hypothetical protein C6N34_006870 [Cylindrospermopsis raciborskii Cr2010]UJS04403.1 hypothetical protein L3I90_15215 [Cylindrospermopsis raciborskii KLL07]
MTVIVRPPGLNNSQVSSTEIACGVDKPLKNHLETTMKQEVGSKVQIREVWVALGRSYRAGSNFRASRLRRNCFNFDQHNSIREQ